MVETIITVVVVLFIFICLLYLQTGFVSSQRKIDEMKTDVKFLEKQSEELSQEIIDIKEELYKAEIDKLKTSVQLMEQEWQELLPDIIDLREKKGT